MIRAVVRYVRLALAKRAYDAANADYQAYTCWDTNPYWSFSIAHAKRSRLVHLERVYSHLING